MKKITSYLVFLFITTALLSGFKSTAQESLDTPNSEFGLLVQYLEENGNFINTDSPALVLAEEIKDNLNNKKYLVIDTRTASWYAYGHIKNSVNVAPAELLNYFEKKITPSNFDKITIVCYSGQAAAYYTSLLRLAGYNNAYSLKWGMSSWANEFAEKMWVKNATNLYANKLQTTPNEMPAIGESPILKTGKTDAKEILNVRLKAAFAKPYSDFIVKTDSVFKNPADFYIVNYVNEDNYNVGHIEGAVRYEPKASLASTTSLYTIPSDKKVLVNCAIGQSAAYVVAYLHLLGYDVSNLAYGSNSFMNTKLVEKGMDGFSAKEIKNFPVVE
ncbi:MAG TPA: rhodanese-like domain-containing protein [Lutibacter sp.]